MPDDTPGDEIHALDQTVLAAASTDDLAISFHGGQAPLQRLVLVRSPKCMSIGDPIESDGLAAAFEKLAQRAAFRKIRDTRAGAACVGPARVWSVR